jgi:type II secretory pathway component HofQ
MKRLLSIVPISTLLIASVAAGQTPAGAAQGTARTLVFNLEVLEFSTDLAREIERLAQDRGRIDRLTAEGKVRPVSEIQVRTKSGESASIHTGQRIPIQTASVQGVPQVQYENTGLNLDITPTLTPDDRIAANLKIDLSSVARMAPNSTFFQRSFSTRVSMKPNERVILLSVVQQGGLWPSSSNATTSDSAYGNYLVLLTAKVLD